MNHFQLDFESRLSSWAKLKETVVNLDRKTKICLVDEWWQRAPLLNHYLHWNDQTVWPDPWQLLSENSYCELARALGICYTLIIIGEEVGDLCLASDVYGADTYIVINGSQIDSAKYILNYHPDTVISNTLQDFNIKHAIPLHHFKNRIN